MKTKLDIVLMLNKGHFTLITKTPLLLNIFNPPLKNN